MDIIIRSKRDKGRWTYGKDNYELRRHEANTNGKEERKEKRKRKRQEERQRINALLFLWSNLWDEEEVSWAPEAQPAVSH